MSDELSSALRELAASRATQPAVDGKAIRARAIRRRRRRTAVALGAGTAALVLLGLALKPALDGHPDQPAAPRIPAADGTATGPERSLPPSSAAPAPVSGTLSLPERTLTVGGRVLPVLSAFDGRTRLTGSLTVTAKHTERDLVVDVPSEGPLKVNVPYVVELRDTQGRLLRVGMYTKPLALGDPDTTGDWLGLDGADAKWFYSRVRLGDRMALRTVTAPSATPSDRASAARGERGGAEQTP
ncbi:hypothetical protein [Streptomyces sp. NPDC056464]|uniref:hypothetical protein n=1 Tax=Streptomyces sp. NPDC056464 TaxID=3345828 RepID=UPI0036B38A3A